MSFHQKFQIHFFFKQHLSLSTLVDKNIQSWENCDRTFLVTIYNISPIQKHTTFRTPINSTAIHVITQVNFQS